MHRLYLLLLFVVAFTVPAMAAPPAAPAYPGAPTSDPMRAGWMQGAPPPADKRVLREDMGFSTFPKTRWSFANMRQLVPSANIWRGDGGASMLPRAEREDIDRVRFTPTGAAATMSWEESLDANYTDAIVVLHRGSIVYERYRGVMTPHTPHMVMSVTKSFVGTIAAMLVHEGRLDPARTVAHYLPELAHSGFGDATVRQVLDMTVAIDYSEDYTDPGASFGNHLRAGDFFPRPAGYDGPGNYYESLASIGKKGEHGRAFDYKTVNTDVLGWLIRRITGRTLAEELSLRFWQPLGMEQDGYILVDRAGLEFAGGGLNMTVRDMARFGEMMRNRGTLGARRIVPRAVVEDIRRGGSREDFAKAGYTAWQGWSYRNQWWITHDRHGAFLAIGVHGQAIYVDPVAEMVIARVSSHPLASNLAFTHTSIPAYEAVADLLMRRGG